MFIAHIILASAFFGVAAASNVTHLTTTVIAIGSSTTTGVDLYVPASNGNTVGVIESKDAGKTLSYTENGETIEAVISMATAASFEDKSVVVGGLFGAGYSMDAGQTWAPLGGLHSPALTTQDIKYEQAAGLYAVTGSFLGKPGVAISAKASENFTTIEVDGSLLISPYIRYGSVPTADTLYVTAGEWAQDSAARAAHRAANTRPLTPRLTVAADGRLAAVAPAAAQRAPSGASTWQEGDPWCQVLKSTDGGATWAMVYNDTTSGLYPNDISCWDANTCAFVKDGTGTETESVIVTTTDGGESWTEFSVPSGPGNTLMPVRMVGPTEVWAAGGSNADTGEMWHTTDLVNWDKISTTLQEAAFLTAFAIFPSGEGCYATGMLVSQVCSVLKIDF